jgi:hypothetical protein
MNLFQNIYLKALKRRFYKSFRPIGITKRDNFLISPPHRIKDFFKVLPVLGGIRKLGNVILLLPDTSAPYTKVFRPDYFQIVYWKEIPRVLTKEFESLKEELKKFSFNWLIELNPEANTALPNLIDAEKRITFYNNNVFPFYNILIKGGIEGLINFLQIPLVDPLTIFKFRKPELKPILKELPPVQPRLFFNRTSDKPEKSGEVQWTGSIVYHDKDNTPIEVGLKKLYLCDAYLGPDDELCELARIFKKELILV